MPSVCCTCGRSKEKDPDISLHRFPKSPEGKKKWMDGLNLSEDVITPESRVCSRHFRDGNPKNPPSIHLGEKFTSGPSIETERGKRRASREVARNVTKRPRTSSIPCTSTPQSTPKSTPRVTPDGSREWSESSSVSLVATDSEPFLSQTSSPHYAHNLQVTVNVALASQVEMLTAENQKLKSQLSESKTDFIQD